jgi:hypothetical protein
VEHIQPQQQQVRDSLPPTKQHNFSNKTHNSLRFRFIKLFPLFPGHSTQWRPLLPNGRRMIQMDIGGHPPIPNSNCLILTVFSSTRFSVIGTFLCNCGFCTYVVVLKPYTIYMWILVAACWVCVILFARVVVSERMRRARRGSGATPPRIFLLASGNVSHI